MTQPEDSAGGSAPHDQDALRRNGRLLLVFAAGERAGRPTIARDEAVGFVVLEVSRGDRLALKDLLGHPPFERRLYRALGDLVELGLVSQGIDGFGLTEPGRQVADQLERGYSDAVASLAAEVRAMP